MTEIETRTAAMNYLDVLRSKYGDVLKSGVLRLGFSFRNEKINYVSQQGIFKPRQMELPLTITSVFNGPYQDNITDDFLKYKYRGFDSSYLNHRDNIGLRECMKERLPLIYFHGIDKGKYMPVYPVFIIDDNPDQMEFIVATDDIKVVNEPITIDYTTESYRRRYLTKEVKLRLHQAGFRERIMKAYRESCAFCRLKHTQLLDAAHIVPDSEGGTSEIQNGMALCKIHHSAFDNYILGVDTDYRIHVREDILHEIDGPMLKHGIQGMDGLLIHKPRGKNSPKREYLDYKFQLFKSA